MVDPALRFGLGGEAADLFGRPVAPGDKDIPSRAVLELTGFDLGLFGGGLHGADIVRQPGNIQIAMYLTLAFDHSARRQWQPPRPVPTAN